MRPEELMVGDWVNVDGRKEPSIVIELSPKFPSTEIMVEYDAALHVDKIPCSYPGSMVHPIPITAEILAQNGFRYDVADTADADYYCLGEMGKEWLTISRKTGTLIFEDGYDVVWLVCSNVLCADVRYVHELQHAFRLAGINKEITI